ncbi:hypothetical protein F8C76_02540 [Flagellimonas olearia]|uniref:DUF2268 domain-containing protein n=1 Tax=Flagellimonas olearia TaxID=552546 RepID=A0A6I1E3I6_9FLAO|nr:hypothetical protein [Allomuricauda olearia]KAB7530405.1 hypothetical protein F8C76_02540 [Allomuricauda olearia]
MKKIINSINTAVVIQLFTLTLYGQENKQQVFTTDIDNFWKAYDTVQTINDRQRQIDLMQTLYIDKGTKGLEVFMTLRNFGAERLVNTVNEYPEFWKSIRPNTFLVKSKETEINSSLKKFRKLYPGLQPAQIYFTISAIRSGGTVKDSIVMIGSEIATGNAATNVSEFPDKRLETFFKTQKEDYIVPIAIHEYVHTQQKSEGKILLGQALCEGACDFITELVLETDLQNAYILYGKKHEKQLKEQFKEEMYSEDFSNWLYNGATTETVGDLGYFMGYAICKAYYDSTENKENAIAEIIELDYADTNKIKAFLRQSKYYKNL